jgi:Crescentin protein
MRPVWEKLFRSRAKSANTSKRSVPRHESESETPGASGKDPRRNSDKIARTFDSIGRRNEALRAQLDSIECSFQNIEAIRAQFHDALTPIDQTLAEIERTKVAQLEAERKLESLSAAHERLKGDRAELSVERDALASAQDKLLARVADLERMVMESEAASSEARSTLAEQSAKREQMERELEDNRRGLRAANERLPAIRGEFAAKESLLQEVERQRAALNDRCDLLTQENATLRMRVEEFVANTSKLGRQFTNLKDQRDELKRRLEEVETSFGQEKTAHATLRAAHLDAMEAQRLSEANLQEKFVATTTRLEAAGRLLAEARVGLHEQDAAIREFEQQALEKSLATKSLEAQIADLEKDLAAARSFHVEVEVARAAAVEESATLVKFLKDKEVALQRAEQKMATLEASVEEQKRATIGERALLEEKIARLTEQLEAESAARLFAEGALQTARQERNVHRHDDAVVASPNEALSSKEATSAKAESAQGKILRLRR